MEHVEASTEIPVGEGQYCTVTQLAQDPKLPGIKQSNIRAWIFQAEDRFGSGGARLPGNGLAPAIIRVGRKVLIDRDLFFGWLEGHRMVQVESSEPKSAVSPTDEEGE